MSPASRSTTRACICSTSAALPALPEDCCRDHIDGGPFAPGPVGKCRASFPVLWRQRRSRRCAVTSLPCPMSTKPRTGNLAFAPAEHDFEECRDRPGSGSTPNGSSGRRGVVKTRPGAEADDLVTTQCPQQRAAHGQKRHSKKSRLVAMRGSSSPAPVAWRMRTPRSDMRCASPCRSAQACGA